MEMRHCGYRLGMCSDRNLFDVGRHHQRIHCELCRLRLNGAVSINDNSAPRYVDDIHPVTSEELDSH